MKFIVPFDSKTDEIDPSFLGGKGASLKNMVRLQLPVPPGFVLTAKVWKLFYQKGRLPKSLQSRIFKSITFLEKQTGKRFGSEKNPLLLSVRSGAKYSMPGMMDTILNVGINRQIVSGLARISGDGQWAWDTYRRFIKIFAASVYQIHEGEFDLIGEKLAASGQNRKLTALYHRLVYKRTGKRIPNDPKTQLIQAVTAVLNSWFNPGAVAFRQINGIPETIGTAVNIQAMVYGNRKKSGTGVLFSRDTQTGENKFTGDYMENAQGQDIVRGDSAKKTMKMKEFSKKYLKVSRDLFKYAKILEKFYKDIQDIEFTVEDGNIWLLQTRAAERSPLANIRFAKDLLKEKIIGEDEAFRRVKPGDIEYITAPAFNFEQEKASRFFAKGVPASCGVATGILCLAPEKARELFKSGKEVILARDHIDPNDVDTLMMVAGVVTTKGSASSHMAIIMRSAGKPGVVGCSDLVLKDNKVISSDGRVIRAGEEISINAAKGTVYKGRIKKEAEGKIPKDISIFVAQRIKKLGKSPWSAALYLENGAPNLPILLNKTKKIYGAAVKKWQSQKARTIETTSKMFPQSQMINNLLIKPRDTVSLKKALLSVIKDGYFNAPRTCHYPEKLAGAPWADGPNNEKEIDNFLANPNYPGKYGGYPRWIEDKNLNAIIVGKEPQGKLDPNLANKHFVCTISCLATYPPQVVVNLNFGTAQLRSLERVENTSLITIKAALYSKAKYELGNISYQVGEEYFDKSKIKRILKAIQENNWQKRSPQERKLVRAARHFAKQIIAVHPKIKLSSLTVEILSKIARDLMSQNSLPENVYKHIVSTRVLSLLNKISKKIFEEWWPPPMVLPYLMAVLDETAGLSVVEAQGRVEGDDLVWFKIYGAKGAEEKEKIANWREK